MYIMILFLENVFFRPKLSFSAKKSWKIFEFGKVRKFPEETVIIKENAFHLPIQQASL